MARQMTSFGEIAVFSQDLLTESLDEATKTKVLSESQVDQLKKLLVSAWSQREAKRHYDENGGCGGCLQVFSQDQMKQYGHCPHCDREETKWECHKRWARENRCTGCGRPHNCPSEPCYCFWTPRSPTGFTDDYESPQSPKYIPTTPKVETKKRKAGEDVSTSSPKRVKRERRSITVETAQGKRISLPVESNWTVGMMRSTHSFISQDPKYSGWDRGVFTFKSTQLKEDDTLPNGEGVTLVVEW